MKTNNIEKKSLEIVLSAMPETFRSLYESGEAVRVKIVRQKYLKGYGREISLRIWKGVMLSCDMSDYISADRIARDVIGYFLTGEKAKVCVGYDGTDSVYTGDYGIRYSL